MTKLNYAGSAFAILIASASSAALAQAAAPGVGSAQAPSQIGANDASNPPSAAASGANAGEIVVTAQRRSELQREVPISITALSADQLKQADVKQLGDIAKITPALRFDYIGPNVQPTIRGVGTSFTTSGGLGDVGIYIDGFYAPNPLGDNFQLLNVQGIQVLKGPQGTLFGRNTTGGAILVTTAKPSQDTAATFEGSYGSYNTYRLQGYATTGLNEKIAVDLEGLYSASDGFIHNIVTGNDHVGAYHNWTIRAGLKLDPTDDISFLLRYEHNKTDDPSAQLSNAYVKNGVTLTAGLSPQIEAILGVPTVATKPDEVANSSPVSFRAKGDIFQLTGSDDLGFATLTSYTQYRHETSTYVSDLDYSSSHLFDLRVPNYEKTFTQEFLLASNPGPKLQWTTGVFYFNYVDSYPATADGFFGAPLAVFASSASKTSSIAAFVDGTYEFSPKLFFTVGARYSHDMVTSSFFSTPDASGALMRNYVPNLTGDKVTPRVVLRYKPSAKSSVYASYTLGYKPGLLNVGGGNFTDLNIKPEKISAYEIGFKYGDRAFSFDTAAYYYDYKNLQVSSYNGVQSILTNAATARIWGIEAETRYKFDQHFSVNASVAYTNAKYRKFLTAPFYDVAHPDPASGLYPIGDADVSGMEMQHAPKFTATAGAQYATELARGHFVLSGNLYYTSKFYFDAADEFPQKAYETLGLRAEWTDPSNRYTLAVFGDNVTDTHYRTQVLPSNFGIGSMWAFPATVAGSLRVKF